MSREVKSVYEIDTKELDQELIARGAQTPEDVQFKFKDPSPHPERDAFIDRIKNVYRTPSPPNHAFNDLNNYDIAKILIVRNQNELDITRGDDGMGIDMDYNEISEEQIRKNAGCVAVLFMKDSLTDTNNGYSILNTLNYGKTFNLNFSEPFRDQPIISGPMCSGFLVADDVIATSGLSLNEHNITDLCVTFGYKMLDSSASLNRFPNDAIYHGKRILHSSHIPGSDENTWTLVKLDRKVEGQRVAVLSGEEVYRDQECYSLGYPLGLPLKCSGGGVIHHLKWEICFEVYLKIYACNNGSPVFDFYNHEVLGMVIEGAPIDLRYTEKGWISALYPNRKKIVCIRTEPIRNLLRNL